MKSQDASDPLARTVAVNALVIGQVFYLLNSRFKIDLSLSPMAHLGNPYLPAGIGAVVVLQLLYTYAPPLQHLFETEGVPLRVWPWLFLGGLIFFLVVEAEKAIIRASVPNPRPRRPPPDMWARRFRYKRFALVKELHVIGEGLEENAWEDQDGVDAKCGDTCRIAGQRRSWLAEGHELEMMGASRPTPRQSAGP